MTTQNMVTAFEIFSLAAMLVTLIAGRKIRWLQSAVKTARDQAASAELATKIVIDKFAIHLANSVKLEYVEYSGLTSESTFEGWMGNLPRRCITITDDDIREVTEEMGLAPRTLPKGKLKIAIPTWWEGKGSGVVVAERQPMSWQLGLVSNSVEDVIVRRAIRRQVGKLRQFTLPQEVVVGEEQVGWDQYDPNDYALIPRFIAEVVRS